MNDEQLLSRSVFPFFFVGMWLLVTTIFGFASGWFNLQQRYAAGDEAALLTLRGRSGSMGMGVALNGIITLWACPSGLRISIWKVFAPFQRPILIRWKDIHATPSRSLFAPATQLSFGAPELGRLKIDARSWERLRTAAAEGILRWPEWPSGERIRLVSTNTRRHLPTTSRRSSAEVRMSDSDGSRRSFVLC